ncbi:MAG: hypothetical protein RLZZ546_303, partial [Bacteroidota bacterium]
QEKKIEDLDKEIKSKIGEIVKKKNLLLSEREKSQHKQFDPNRNQELIIQNLQNQVKQLQINNDIKNNQIKAFTKQVIALEKENSQITKESQQESISINVDYSTADLQSIIKLQQTQLNKVQKNIQQKNQEIKTLIEKAEALDKENTFLKSNSPPYTFKNEDENKMYDLHIKIQTQQHELKLLQENNAFKTNQIKVLSKEVTDYKHKYNFLENTKIKSLSEKIAEQKRLYSEQENIQKIEKDALYRSVKEREQVKYEKEMRL